MEAHLHQITCIKNQVIHQARSYYDCVSSDDDTAGKSYRWKAPARSLKAASLRSSRLHSIRSKASSRTTRERIFAVKVQREIERQNEAALRLREEEDRLECEKRK